MSAATTGSPLRSLLPVGRRLGVVDLVVAAWVALWVAMGVAIAGEVRGLRQLSGTVTRVGVAVQQTGQTLEGLSGVPLVGDKVAGAARDVDAAGRSAIQSGRRSRESIHSLSWMLGVFLAVIPTVPLLALYVPARVAIERERRALRRLVADHRDDPVLRRLLAQRALLTLPYQQLVDGEGHDPIDQARDERMNELADAELERLGLARSARR